MKKSIFATSILSLALLASALSFNNVALNGEEISKKTLSLNEILDNVVEEKLSSSEKDYVNQNISYSIDIPTIESNDVRSYVHDGVLYINVRPHEENHKIWIPKDVKYNLTSSPSSSSYKSFDLSNGEYVCTFDNVDENIKDFEINYEISFDVDASIINKAINITYDTVSYYDALEKYETNKNLWEQYEVDKENYDSELAKYNKYLTDKKAYDEYVLKEAEYQQYLVDKANYDAVKSRIVNDKSLVDQANLCLKIMDFAYTPMKLIDGTTNPGTRIMYESIMGSAVESVLGSNSSQLELLGAPAAWISSAREATNYLRDVLPKYKDLDTNEKKYNYFNQIYDSLFKYSYQLFRYLEALFRISNVQKAIAMKDRIPQYQLLIGQLAFFTRALAPMDGATKKVIYNREGFDGETSNAKVIDNNWTFLGSTISRLVGEIRYDYDLSLPGNPSTDFYPIYVNDIKEPVKVDKPVAVIEPSVVNEPINPTAPSEKLIKPTKPEGIKELTAEQHYLIDEFNSGDSIKHREEKDSYTYKETQKIKYDLKTTEGKMAFFYDLNNKLIHYEFFDEHPKYKGIPSKDGDEYYQEYYFDGWKDKDGNVLSLDEINKSISLYPTFKGSSMIYHDIHFVVGENTKTVSFSAGQTPFYGEDPAIEETETEIYVFKGWDKKFVPAFEEETYTAIFDVIHKYKIQFIVDGEIVSSQVLKEGEMPIIPEVNDIMKENKYLIFFNWSSTVVSASKDFTYEAIFDEYQYVTLTYKSSSGVDEILKVKQGEIPTSPPITTYYDLTYKHVFVEWHIDLNNGFAVYNNINIFSDKTVANLKDKTLTLDASLNNGKVDLSKVKECYQYILENIDTVIIDFGNYDMTLSKAMFNSLLSKDIQTFSFKLEKNNFGIYSISTYGIDSKNLEISASLNATINSDFNFVNYVISYDSIVENSSLIDNKITMVFDLCKEYKITPIYTISISEDPSINFTISPQGKAGEYVSFTYTLSPGYILKEISITTDSGKSVGFSHDSNVFMMPDENISISATLEQIVYTVTYYVDDEIYLVQEYHYGDLVKFPTKPKKKSTGSTKYAFSSWNFEETIVKKDMEVHATFVESKIQNEFLGALLNASIYIVPVILVLILVGAVIIIRNRKKAKKLKKGNTL